jgi:uncharacterized membrane protein
MENWNTFNSSAYVENDVFGNVMYALHVLLAIIMIVGGSLQLIPSIRQKYTRFHRINGRVFVTLACIISLAGLYLITARGTVGNPLLHSLTALSGLIVIVSSIFAVTTARKRNIAAHQVWAIRLYLAANGVLFFRLIMFAWFLGFGSLGINTEDFTGPTVVGISVCAYIMPLLIFEFIRRVESLKQKLIIFISSAVLIMIGLVFFAGLVGISLGNWLPAISA